ncbi:MAG: hypothetical protein HZA90_08895 [Verrucomicrobia bacterium]|nr:hypothetical protein [Verrucomicrobiota bacterium]
MKTPKLVTSLVLAATFAAAPFTALAAEAKPKAKPYPLKNCLVSDEKLGEMGDPYVFTYKGQEIKLCCKSCLKDFNKDPKKFLKKIEDADKEKK